MLRALQALRRLGPAAEGAGRLQPRPRLRRRARSPDARGVLGDGRHDQHGRAHHVEGGAGPALRAPGRPRALAHALRDRAGRPVRDEGQGAAPARLLGGGGVRHPRGGRGRTTAAARARRRARRAARRPGARRRRRGWRRHGHRRDRHGQDPARARGGGGARGRHPAHGARRALRRVELLPRLPRPAAPAARHRARDPAGHGPPAPGSPWRRRRPTCCPCRRSSPTWRTSRCRPRPRPTRSTRSTGPTGSPTCSSTSSAAWSRARSC